MTDDEQHLTSVALCERRHDEPLIATDSGRGDEAFLLEPMQRTSYRRPAQPESLHHRAFRDPSAWRKLAGYDQGPQLLIDARNVVVSLGRERETTLSIGRRNGSVAVGSAGL
jgi:hypothetical protein